MPRSVSRIALVSGLTLVLSGLALGAVAVLRKEDTATRLPEIMGQIGRQKAEAGR